MRTRRTSRASRGELSRFYFSRRTFDEVIEELTEQSIDQSLQEIDKQLHQRFASPLSGLAKPKRRKATDSAG